MSFIDRYYYKNFIPLYEGFRSENWSGDDPIFKKLVEEVKPKTIIEVGSWKGQSSIAMANATKELNLNSTLYCVDTWLGGIDIDPKFTKNRFGYPNVYFDFLTNVVNSECQDIIIPCPNTSVCFHQVFKKENIKADLIFIDASHQEEDVYRDIVLYWELLNDGGILYGHDYPCKGVKRAVLKFASEYNLQVTSESYEVFWVIKKK